jgi:hypothetical protein
MERKNTLYRTQEDEATTSTTTTCTFPPNLQLAKRMRVAFWVRCFMEKAETWVNGIRKTWSKTWSTDGSDTRVGERKIRLPMLHCSQIVCTSLTRQASQMWVQNIVCCCKKCISHYIQTLARTRETGLWSCCCIGINITSSKASLTIQCLFRQLYYKLVSSH